ncbi:LytTR family transcriptional regulator [Niastella caeni]|uniref:LytTR family transcriptional regulator n=1 Tax=Niastella caeni TaxID=2569763 RepID=A0A4S8HI92_9BACT|nr:LytTR family DNA-binding domain-containing protein [Niastella caeni]THU34753.1 LytTR family transcriptional regulator [Niastella caeni]
MSIEKFLIPHRDTIHVVDYSSILFFKSDNCYTHVFLAGGAQFVLVKSLSKLEKEINSPRFIRISQSFLVNRHFITSIHKKKKSILLEQQHVLPFTISIKTLLHRMVG